MSIMVLTVFTSFSQTVKKEEYYIFLNSINQQDSSIVILEKKAAQIDFKEIKDDILTDSLFTQEDKAFLISQIENIKNFKWEKGKLKNVKIIRLNRRGLWNRIKRVLQIKQDFWEKFHRNYGENSGYSSLSIPIFTIDRKTCIVYSSWIGGWLNGSGGVMVLKKVGNKWSIIKYYTMWVS